VTYSTFLSRTRMAATVSFPRRLHVNSSCPRYFYELGGPSDEEEVLLGTRRILCLPRRGAKTRSQMFAAQARSDTVHIHCAMLSEVAACASVFMQSCALALLRRLLGDV
jgi:hypothetical protein